MPDSIGALTTFALEPDFADPHVFDSSSEVYEFVSESVGRQSTVIDTDGIRGTRSHHKARTRAGQYTIGGTILLHPSPLDLDKLLPRILGTAESADSFVLADVPTVPVGTFGLAFDRDVDAATQIHQYTQCQIGAATFRGSGNGLVELELEIVGVAEIIGTPSSNAFQALGKAPGDAPYQFFDSVLSIFSATTVMNSFEIRIDNHPEVRFGNSQTATSITFQDRTITLNVNVPYDLDNDSHYGAAAASPTPDAPGTLTLTNGNMSTLFTFVFLQNEAVSPSVSGKGPVTLDLSFTARMSGTDRELVITHDGSA